MSSWHGPFQSSGIICTHTDFSDQFRSVSTHHNRTAYGHRIWRQLATIFYFSFFWLVLLFPTTLWFLLMLWRWLVNTHMWRRIYRKFELPRWTFWRQRTTTTITCLFSFAKQFASPFFERGKREGKVGEAQWQASVTNLLTN